MFCGYCGRQNAEDYSFCTGCGEALENESPNQAVQPEHRSENPTTVPQENQETESNEEEMPRSNYISVYRWKDCEWPWQAKSLDGEIIGTYETELEAAEAVAKHHGISVIELLEGSHLKESEIEEKKRLLIEKVFEKTNSTSEHSKPPEVASEDDSSLDLPFEATSDYRTIERLKPVSQYFKDNETEKKIGIFLDTETTGLNADSDKIIELAMVPFEFDTDGRIYRILPEYNELNDPGISIPEIATQITGITDEMVKGHSINLDKVKNLLSDAVIVIAHNASFDRPFCEILSDEFENIHWGCSMKDINWKEEGIEGMKLDYIAYRYGFFFEGHRATIDCQAGIEILSRPLFETGEFALKRLIDNAQQTKIRLWALGAPFDKKDELKKRNYRWNPGENDSHKAWYVDLLEGEVENEMAYLKKHIFPREIGELPMDRLNSMLRYSRRI
jgi:DNA polymerase III subunit epsilon